MTENETRNIEGIDVAIWQGRIDWQKVKASGIAFAYIKATEGTLYRNPNFARDWSESQHAGIIRGAYHFFDPTKSPLAQAKHFVSTVGPWEGQDLPPALDLEGISWNSIPQAARLSLVLEWLVAVEDSWGVSPFIYTNYFFARDVLRTQDNKSLSRFKLWIANWNQVDHPPLPAPWSEWTIWQYSDAGRIPGAIAGKVDRDRFAGTVAELRRLRQSSARHQSL